MFFLGDTMGDKEILGQFARSENVALHEDETHIRVTIPESLVNALWQRSAPQLFRARKSKRNLGW